MSDLVPSPLDPAAASSSRGVDSSLLPSPLPAHPSWLPALIARQGEKASRRFAEFFSAEIRNPNTRRAYLRAVGRFCAWCEEKGIPLDRVQPALVAAWVEERTRARSAPTVKQELAALRMFFNYLVLGQVEAVPHNPAAPVRGPKHVVKKGKTPVLEASDARKLLDSIDASTVVGLRDRALIAAMVYSFARVGAVVKMRVEDYFPQGKRWWFRLIEKGGKHHEVPAHHAAEAILDAYLERTGLAGDRKGWLFRTVEKRNGGLTERPMATTDVLRMVKRRARRAELPGAEAVCCHTFRATGITTYLENGGTLEVAQAIAAHESPRTTKLYDRTADKLSLEEIERVRI